MMGSSNDLRSRLAERGSALVGDNDELFEDSDELAELFEDDGEIFGAPVTNAPRKTTAGNENDENGFGDYTEYGEYGNDGIPNFPAMPTVHERAARPVVFGSMASERVRKPVTRRNKNNPARNSAQKTESAHPMRDRYEPEYHREHGHPFNVGTKGGRQRAVKAAQQEAQANGLLFFEAIPNKYDYGIVITSRGGYSQVFGGNFNVDTEYGEDGTVIHTLNIYVDGDVSTDSIESEPNQSLGSFLRQQALAGKRAMAEHRQIVTKSRKAATIEKNGEMADCGRASYRPVYDRKNGHPFDFANEGTTLAVKAATYEGLANGLIYKGDDFHTRDRGVTVSFQGPRMEYYDYCVSSSYNEDGTVDHYISIGGNGNGIPLFEERHSKPNQDLKSFLRGALEGIDKRIQAAMPDLTPLSGEMTMSKYIGIAGSFS
jgi:uncharacterized protein with PIN domain